MYKNGLCHLDKPHHFYFKKIPFRRKKKRKTLVTKMYSVDAQTLVNLPYL